MFLGAFAVVLCSCGGAGGGPDSGPGEDSGGRPDGRVMTDASAAEDAGAGEDAAPRDGGDAPAGSFGLEWDGTAAERRMLFWSAPPAAFDATYLFKVHQRDQVRGVGDGSRYYTTFFHGQNGEFVWGSAYADSYYGAHPYPIPAPAGDGRWEISAGANDFVDRDDGSSPFVENGRWYSQAFVAEATGGDRRLRFYIDLPGVGAADRITQVLSGPYVEPPEPIICVGQAPDNGSGASWGGYSRWEEQNAIIRGIQIYASALTEAQILALEGLETDAEVLAATADLGITSLWYLNMNPRPGDVTDKRGSGPPHDPSWDGTAAAEWRAP
jgi:hypothetical protein